MKNIAHHTPFAKHSLMSERPPPLLCVAFAPLPLTLHLDSRCETSFVRLLRVALPGGVWNRHSERVCEPWRRLCVELMQLSLLWPSLTTPNACSSTRMATARSRETNSGIFSTLLTTSSHGTATATVSCSPSDCSHFTHFTTTRKFL
jgi:hypothetical protein